MNVPALLAVAGLALFAAGFCALLGMVAAPGWPLILFGLLVLVLAALIGGTGPWRRL